MLRINASGRRGPVIDKFPTANRCAHAALLSAAKGRSSRRPPPFTNISVATPQSHMSVNWHMQQAPH